VKCPKHTTGGGPCYCGKVGEAPVYDKGLREYTLNTAAGNRIVQISKTLTEALHMSGDPDVVSCVSKPWGPSCNRECVGCEGNEDCQIKRSLL
jgi:hypothetical protein